MNAAKINRAVALVALPENLWWESDKARTMGQEPSSHDDYPTINHGHGLRTHYEPMSNAAQAFELVERFGLCLVGPQCINPHEWRASTRVDVNCTYHTDLKTAICLCVLKMHGIDPDAL